MPIGVFYSGYPTGGITVNLPRSSVSRPRSVLTWMRSEFGSTCRRTRTNSRSHPVQVRLAHIGCVATQPRETHLPRASAIRAHAEPGERSPREVRPDVRDANAVRERQRRHHARVAADCLATCERLDHGRDCGADVLVPAHPGEDDAEDPRVARHRSVAVGPVRAVYAVRADTVAAVVRAVASGD